MVIQCLNTVMKSICVFCGSRSGHDAGYAKLADETGTAIGNNGFRLVYGGGSFGLMGIAARAAFKVNENVLGIIPEFLIHEEGSFAEAEQRIVPDMHTRKLAMNEESDAFIILPGGIGTIEEAVEILSWARLQLHQKPIVFLSHNNYWDAILDLFNHTISEGFTPKWLASELIQASDANSALQQIKQAWDNPKEKRKLWTDF